MKKLFVKELHTQMTRNDKIWFLVGGVGFNAVEPLFGKRFINCEASEQAMVDIAVGLALNGQIPFVYTITPFLLYRPFEAIRNYLNSKKIPVKLIGIGRGRDYGGLGFTHWVDDDRKIMRCFKNIKSYWPDRRELKKLIRIAIVDESPYYINLSKT